MKRIIFIYLILFGSMINFIPDSFAQTETHPPHPGPAGREPDYTKLKSDYSLSDDQIISWKAVEDKYKAKFKELQANAVQTDDEKRTELKQLLKSKEEELQKILSDDQYARLASNRPQRKDKK